MRIVHTADLHIGKTLGSYDLHEDQVQILRQISRLTKEAEAQALIIAGDIFDRSLPSAEAVSLASRFFTEASQTLRIPILFISGNHDSPERLGFCADLLSGQGLYVRTGFEAGFEPVVLPDAHGPVEIYLIPFADPVSLDWARQRGLKTHAELWRAVAAEITARPGTNRRILVAHLTTLGGAASDSERPLAIGGSAEVPLEVFESFNYVALGHLHRRQAPSPRVHYSGSPLGYSASEANQAKCILQVDLAPSGDVAVADLTLQPLRAVQKLTGQFAELLAASGTDTDAYTFIQLTDAQPVFEAFHRLSQKYPRLVHVARTAALAPTNATGHTADELTETGGDRRLIDSFSDYCTGQPLSAIRQAMVDELVADLARSDSA